MCQRDLTKVVYAGCIFSVKSCIKTHYVGAEVRRKIMKLEQNSFSLYFLTLQNCSFNSDHLYASALKLIYLKHNIDCFITIHCFFKFRNRRVAEVFEGVFVLTGIFIKGGYQIRVPKARASWGVWGHAPSGNFEI